MSPHMKWFIPYLFPYYSLHLLVNVHGGTTTSLPLHIYFVTIYVPSSYSIFQLNSNICIYILEVNGCSRGKGADSPLGHVGSLLRGHNN